MLIVRHVIESYCVSTDDDPAAQAFSDYSFVCNAVLFASNIKIDCSYEFCVLCNGNIFATDEEIENNNDDDDYFPNPCKNCLQDIEKELLKTNIELPTEMIKNIVSYIVIE